MASQVVVQTNTQLVTLGWKVGDIVLQTHVGDPGWRIVAFEPKGPDTDSTVVTLEPA